MQKAQKLSRYTVLSFPDDKKPLIEKSFFETSVLETQKELASLVRLGKELEIDKATGQVKKDHLSKVDAAVKKIKRGLKQAKEYISQSRAEYEPIFEELEGIARDCLEKVEDRKQTLERNFATGDKSSNT